MMNSGSSGDDDDAIPPFSSNNSYSLSSTHVSYSCGSCGYELNLNSCNRNISVIDAKYEKLMKRGVISFFSVDESRKCGNYIGTARMDDTYSSSSPFEVVKSSPATWDGISARRTYEIKIRSLRPLLFEGSALLV
ncbi:hypothetical protein BUALT_Bualt18G0011100 [Buddleja alternifolia]|uniref:Uncharacterized protein n=1 Tax=Buddleja alternifolia TaxID=168488 RepID=A0AAV6WCC5_9LAMI|nr:hypothetical protein BUALT_Bualt18G0011100 [Buddleja alternifolia]